MSSIFTTINDGLHDALDKEYDIERYGDGYNLVMSVQLLNRILRTMELTMIDGFQGRLTTEVTETRTKIIAELLNIATVEPVTMEIVISKEDYNGMISLPTDAFIQSVSEVITVTGIVDYLLDDEPLMMMEPVWDIRYSPNAYVAIELAKMLMFSPMEEEIICITHNRINIPDEVLELFLASCICSPITMFDLYSREWDEYLMLETLAKFDEELKNVQHEIVERLVNETDIPGEYILAMLLVINGDYEDDFDIAQYCILVISEYWSEDVERAIMDVVSTIT
jgi:hypothetical protein